MAWSMLFASLTTYEREQTRGADYRRRDRRSKMQTYEQVLRTNIVESTAQKYTLFKRGCALLKVGDTSCDAVPVRSWPEIKGRFCFWLVDNPWADPEGGTGGLTPTP